MNILYIGDIMGQPGVDIVEKYLEELVQTKKIDLVIAQAENVSEGKGITVEDFRHLQKIGVNVFTGGNWSLFRKEIVPYLDDPNEPIVRPANYPESMPGKGFKYYKTPLGYILIISLLGKIVGKDSEQPVNNPLHVIDSILESEKYNKKLTTIVNFHGDYSSEKRVIGYYLDGKVGGVIGDHWHVPTADSGILPNGTAHVTDVGMCGSLDSSLGIRLNVIIDRWHNSKTSRNILETGGRMQFNAVLMSINNETGLGESIERIQIIE